MADRNDEFIIDVRDITKVYDGVTVVDHIAMQVRPGEIYGFLGPNGSGKTTFLRMLCGLLTPDDGEGTCLGYNIREEAPEIKRHVGYMTQRFSFYEDLSIRENLDFVARIYNVPDRRTSVRDALDRLGLESRQHQLTGHLSGGWKQRFALAACLLHQPRLLLLDEPTAGVDPKARRDFWDEIHRLASEGLTVLITTHYMDEAERCHQLAYLAYGHLMTQGTVSEVIQNAGLVTYKIEDGTRPSIAERLRQCPAITQAVAFGTTLHVSGSDRDAMEAAFGEILGPGQKWKPIASELEDVFISLMQQAEDNFR